jgi:hypothetical protein
MPRRSKTRQRIAKVFQEVDPDLKSVIPDYDAPYKGRIGKASGTSRKPLGSTAKDPKSRLPVKVDKKTGEQIFTGYHGTGSTIPKIRGTYPRVGQLQLGRGFHIGSRKAAVERLQGEDIHPRDRRLLKIQIRARNPLGSQRTPLSDVATGTIEKALPKDVDALVYRNVAEDAGSVSVAGLNPKQVRIKDVTQVVRKRRPLSILKMAEESLKRTKIGKVIKAGRKLLD